MLNHTISNPKLHSCASLWVCEPLPCLTAQIACRGLAIVPNIGFVSASHDMTLRLWDFTGEALSVFVGHEALVYSAAGSPDGFLIASASEDKTSRLWGIDGALRQTIPHPGEYSSPPSSKMSRDTMFCHSRAPSLGSHPNPFAETSAASCSESRCVDMPLHFLTCNSFVQSMPVGSRRALISGQGWNARAGLTVYNKQHCRRVRLGRGLPGERGLGDGMRRQHCARVDSR